MWPLKHMQKKALQTGISLHRGPVKGTWRGFPLLGTPRDMSRKSLEMEHLSLYKGSLRGTWREGSYIEYSERHVVEGSGNGVFLFIGAP